MMNADVDMKPVLGAIVRAWQYIAAHVDPAELTVVEALELLGALQRITDRLAAERDAPACPVVTLRSRPLR